MVLVLLRFDIWPSYQIGKKYSFGSRFTTLTRPGEVPPSLSPSSETQKKPARKKLEHEILGAISRGHFFSRGFLSRLARRTK